jgi:hypothetical protein
MIKTLKTMTLSATLAVMFLSAGAFAGADMPSKKIVNSNVTNVTIIHKNSAWPVKGRISVQSCKVLRCVEA